MVHGQNFDKFTCNAVVDSIIPLEEFSDMILIVFGNHSS